MNEEMTLREAVEADWVLEKEIKRVLRKNGHEVKKGEPLAFRDILVGLIYLSSGEQSYYYSSEMSKEGE